MHSSYKNALIFKKKAEYFSLIATQSDVDELRKTRYNHHTHIKMSRHSELNIISD